MRLDSPERKELAGLLSWVWCEVLAEKLPWYGELVSFHWLENAEAIVEDDGVGLVKPTGECHSAGWKINASVGRVGAEDAVSYELRSGELPRFRTPEHLPSLLFKLRYRERLGILNMKAIIELFHSEKTQGMRTI